LNISVRHDDRSSAGRILGGEIAEIASFFLGTKKSRRWAWDYAPVMTPGRFLPDYVDEKKAGNASAPFR